MTRKELRAVVRECGPCIDSDAARMAQQELNTREQSFDKWMKILGLIAALIGAVSTIAASIKHLLAK